MASHDLFTALAVPPLRGRLYGPADDQPGAERTVLLSEALWQRLFGARESIVGEKIQLSGKFYTVVGIMPAAFQYPSNRTERPAIDERHQSEGRPRGHLYEQTEDEQRTDRRAEQARSGE